MFAGFENVVAAQRSFFEFAQAVTAKTIEGSEKLAALNFAAAKAAITEGNEQMHAVLNAKEPAQAAQTAFGFAQPGAEKLAAYAKHAGSIFTETSASVSELVQEQAQASQDWAAEAIDAAAKSAPAGTEPVFTAAKSAFSAVKGAVEQGVNTTRKLAEYAEKSVVTPIKAKGRKAA
jgi:phasin family protein